MGRGVLRERNFRLLFSGQAVSVFGDRMVAVALAFAVLELDGSASDVGLVLAAASLPLVACLLIGGVVADRSSRRTVMIAADLVRVASQGALALLLITGAAQLWMLAALAGLTGAATGFFNPASTGLLPVVVVPERLQEANGLRATAMSIGEIGGPALAGLLVASVGAGWALAVDAATFAVSAAFLSRLRLPPRVEIAASPFIADLRHGWHEFRSRTWVWTFIVSAAIGNMLWGAWSALGPVVADRELGGAAAWGAALAAMGVGALLGGLAAIRVRPRRPLVTATLGVTSFAVALAMLAAGVPVAVLALGAGLAGAGMMTANSIWESTLQRHIPAESLSRVSAYDWFGSLAFYPIGLALWGPLSELLGVDAALWLAAGLMVVATLGLLAVRDIRRLPAAPRSAADCPAPARGRLPSPP